MLSVAFTMKEKKDTSARVPQREKIKGTLDLRPFPWTPRQKTLIDLALDKQTRIIFLSGPAGSTKTILAVYAALELLNQHRVSDILYIRSAVESADKSLGFLPGTADDKMAYYGIPLYEKLEELLPKSDITALAKDKRITVMPVNYVRGQSWNARVAVIDEAQNLTEKELFTILTRLGKFSKAFVLADPMQSDINGKSGGFAKLAKWFADPVGNANGVHSIQLEKADILRDDLIKFLIERYEMLKQTEAQPSGHART